MITRFDRGLLEVYRGLQRGYRRFQGVTGSKRRLQVVTTDVKG